MVRTIRTCSAVALALLAATPASARDEGATYLKARLADARGDVAAAVAGYRVALAADPSPPVALRAYREGLRAGDQPLVRRALEVLEKAGKAPPDAALTRLADAVAVGRSGDIDTALGRLRVSPFAFLLPSVEAWRAPGADPAAAAIDDKESLVRRFAAPTRGLLLLAAGRPAQAQPILAALPGGSPLAARWAAARLLVGQGNRAAAVATLGQDPGPGARPTLAIGVGFLFQTLLDELGDDSGGSVPILLARLALQLQPDDERARVLLARGLVRSGARAEADRLLETVTASSPLAGVAAELRSGDGGDAALARADAIVTRPGAGRADLIRAGDQLMAASRFERAARAYAAAAAVGETADAGLELRWGGALDKAGRWDEAKPRFARALALAPADPDVLNAVGYARVERGEDLAGSLALLERALAAQPDNTAILDSTGWAHYRIGQPARAVPLLERAAAAEASDPVINEHLGDAYWALGRRYEARYAWRAAAIGADEAARARLAERIARGPRAR